MSVGLNRNSPVKLTLSKDNYVALIERHGQWIRWRTAQKCSCINTSTMQPDIHCTICSGRGILYSYQKNQVCFETVLDKGTGILEISENHADCDLVEVYDNDGNRFTNASKLGCFVNLNSSVPIQKGVYYNVIMRQNNVKTINQVTAVKGNMGFYVVPGLMNEKPSVEGVYYDSPSDIISIEKIVDADGVEYKPTELRLNQFRIEPTISNTVDEEGNSIEEEIPISEPVEVYGVNYLPPFNFALLNQNLSKADMQMMLDYQGDAVLTFPYECDVAADDVLTVLAGTYTNKEVVCRTDYDTDTLGVYFVDSISSCSGIINGKYVEYKQGKDFILVGTNKIKWLENDDSIYPDVGEGYSITYQVLPTYKVVKNIPQLRSSENQRFPKKAVVKLCSTYSEMIGINQQTINSSIKGIEGNY